MANTAPTSTLPLPSNDARPSRPTYFQTPAGASAFALRSAQQESPNRSARQLEFVRNAYQATEGGKVYAVESAAPGDEYVVRELPASEVERLQQAGIRHAVERCLDKAAAHELAAGIMRPGAVHAMHKREAQLERDRARELETRLTVAVVHAPPCQLCVGGIVTDSGGVHCRCAIGMARLAKSSAAHDAFEGSNRALPAAEQRD